MNLRSRYLLFGLSLSLVGTSPAREKVPSAWGESRGDANKTSSALAAQEDGRLSVQAAGRCFEFGEGQVAVSAGNSSWAYRFHGAKEGIRALSISTLPEQRAPGSIEYTHGEGIVERYIVRSRGVETVLFYGAAKAVDAAGRTALLEERWSGGELTIVVPASFLATARFPVVVDPYIGGPGGVEAAVDLAQNPAVATRLNSTFQALAVWSTNETSPQSIRGRIIGPRGNTVVNGAISVVDEFSA